MYTDHQNLESFMTTKQLTQCQARWAETLGCFDYEIVFLPGQHTSRLDTLSRRPDLAPDSEDKLSFGSLLKPENVTGETFVEVAPFKSWFKEKTIDLDNTEHWFQIDIMGMMEDVAAPSLEPKAEGAVKTNAELISKVRQLGGQDTWIQRLLDQATGWAEDHHQRAQDGVVYTKGRVKVPDKRRIKTL